MVIRWYRSRRNLLLVLLFGAACMVYYIMHHELNQTLDFDLTRRNSVAVYIEKRLQEALKEDKGSGCEIPKLDPFAKEVTQFDKSLPPVVCDGRDWIKCYLSECKVQSSILDSTTDIKCIYRDIIYESDQKYIIGPPTTVLGDNIYVLDKSDHVKISCSGRRGHSYIPLKWSGNAAGLRKSVEIKAAPDGRDSTYDVLILGFDSTSKNGFIRRMPKSYEILINDLEAVLMNGYNIMGDGTPAALFPILTGKNELELPDVRRVMRNNLTLDVMPFIFYKLKDDGYRTAYFEDMPHIGTFQYRFNGFAKQPADHYLRAFYLEEEKLWKRGKKKYCVGDTPQYSLMLNLTRQFFKRNGKKFCFTFIADITHDDFNMISTADEEFSRFLVEIKRSGMLDNTALIIMSDHGPRYANVRDTLQGKLEERLPLLAIKLPESIQGALVANSHALVTAHDIHATILDVIGFEKYKNIFKVPGADLPRGMSLLELIPANRSCSEAGIEPHWCSCLHWINVSEDEGVYRKAGEELVNYINSLTQQQRALCVPRTLISTVWLMRQRANKQLLSFAAAKDDDGYVGKFTANTKFMQENYQIKVIVGPGKGVYEASMVYLIKEDKFLFDSRDISRTNAYNNEPKCISDNYPNLNMYCYCKD